MSASRVREGIVESGPYQGQEYSLLPRSSEDWLGWGTVVLHGDWPVLREIQLCHLPEEQL